MKQTRSEKSFRVTNCRACLSPQLKLWFSLGLQPPANALLSRISDTEDFFPLDVSICKDCGLVQLHDVVDPKILFENYVYHSSTAASFIEHFKVFAHDTFKKQKLHKGDLVVDIGSNDGILLLPFKELGANVIGVEPAKNIAKVARKKGIPTISKFFTKKVAEAIVKKTGQNANVVTATNVFAHIDNLEEVVAGVKALLTDKGVFIIENPYLWEMVDQGTFDLVYHEHLTYYDMTGMTTLMNRLGLKVIDFEKVSVHGGSLRYFAVKDHSLNVSPKVTQLLKVEKRLRKSNKFDKFAKRIAKNKENFTKLITKLKKDKNIVVGYGAPAKASTILNYYQINSKEIDFIVDDSPYKQNKFLPGVHIPILPTDKLFKINPDYVLILAWNFAKPITKKLRNSGFKGKIITPF